MADADLERYALLWNLDGVSAEDARAVVSDTIVWMGNKYAIRAHGAAHGGKSIVLGTRIVQALVGEGTRQQVERHLSGLNGWARQQIVFAHWTRMETEPLYARARETCRAHFFDNGFRREGEDEAVSVVAVVFQREAAREALAAGLSVVHITGGNVAEEAAFSCGQDYRSEPGLAYLRRAIESAFGRAKEKTAQAPHLKRIKEKTYARKNAGKRECCPV